jgi:hypothetical protein
VTIAKAAIPSAGELRPENSIFMGQCLLQCWRRGAFGHGYYRLMLRPIILAFATLVCTAAVAIEPVTVKVLS